MKTKQLLVLIGLIALAIVFQPVSVSAGVHEAVIYLQAQDQNPWITQALVAAGVTNVPTDHLTSVVGDTATDYAKAILALVAVGENPTTFGNEDYIAKLKTYYNNKQMGDLGLINDDIWAIIALASVGEANSTEAISAKDYLLANQNNDDDGWGYSISAGSDTNDTAAAIMALVEAGVSVEDEVITKAVAYLKSVQNDDGGFGYQIDSESDTNSTSWIVWAIKKLGQSPDSDFWSKSSKTPLDFIESMQNPDGSFGRTSDNTAPNVMATQDAVIALSGNILPLGYFQASDEDDLQPQDGQLRIEGPDGPICNKFLTGIFAYDLLVAGEIECGYTFTGNRDWGTFFLDSINDIENSFPAYWMYLVNNDTTNDGLEQYILQSGDEILIYYDIDTNLPSYPDFDRPLRIIVDNTNPESGEDIIITVEYYNQSWLPAEGATVLGGDQNYQTDASGQVVTSLPFGNYTLFAQKDQLIRSNQEEIMVSATDQIVATPIPQTKSQGSTFIPASDCQSVEYDEWQDACVDSWQYRNVLSEIPSGCALTEEQENQRKRQCINEIGKEMIIEEEMITEEESIVLGVEFILDDQEIKKETAKISNTEDSDSIIINEAKFIVSGDVNKVVLAMNIKRDLAVEENYNKTIVAEVITDSAVTAQERNLIITFVAYGTDTTKVLGAGERAGVINSYRAVFGKLPATEAEWNDCLKIANGYLPDQTNADAENKATETFKKIYLRDADRSNTNDDLAIKIMAYGLRPADRDLDKEKTGLKVFQDIYGYNPFSATDWDIVRAIAYSGVEK